jgi:hypothetical protein
MNAVYKVAPWLPNVDGFDAENSLSSIDAVNLRSWGFNIVRATSVIHSSINTLLLLLLPPR